MIRDIEKHFEAWYPKEGCGLIAIVKGKKRWFPCNNVAKDEEDFIIDSNQFITISQKYDIIAIVHSHPDASSEPSELDIAYCNALGIPYHIYRYPGMDLTIIQPEHESYPLIGREYEFGITDCFEAVKDYYKTQDIVISNRLAFEDNWWKRKRGLNYFSTSYISTWGFKPVTESMQPNDLLIFNFGAAVGNHCGVYLGNDVFYHHAYQRLSCRENLYPFWVKFLTRVYRYET